MQYVVDLLGILKRRVHHNAVIGTTIVFHEVVANYVVAFCFQNFAQGRSNLYHVRGNALGADRVGNVASSSAWFQNPLSRSTKSSPLIVRHNAGAVSHDLHLLSPRLQDA